jgi:hypothetical protein
MQFQFGTKKIALALSITVLFFIAAFMLSKNLSDERLSQIKQDENDIALNILSSETQFSLLKDPSCSFVSFYPNAFSDELNSLGGKLTYMENNLGSGNSDVVSLEKYYSLLEIKDYLLIKALKDTCKTKDVIIRFFYSDLNSCADCKRQQYVLDDLRQNYDSIHVYNFDYDLDLSAVKTIETMYGMKDAMPALIINDKVYYGFQDEDALLKIVPGLAKLKIVPDKATSTATTTIKK